MSNFKLEGFYHDFEYQVVVFTPLGNRRANWKKIKPKKKQYTTIYMSKGKTNVEIKYSPYDLSNSFREELDWHIERGMTDADAIKIILLELGINCGY